jgi:hypothetical protein
MARACLVLHNQIRPNQIRPNQIRAGAGPKHHLTRPPGLGNPAAPRGHYYPSNPAVPQPKREASQRVEP